MSNMSYCRFRNTLTDLQDCEENIWDEPDDEDEARARRALIKICKRIASEFEDEEGTK